MSPKLKTTNEKKGDNNENRFFVFAFFLLSFDFLLYLFRLHSIAIIDGNAKKVEVIPFFVFDLLTCYTKVELSQKRVKKKRN